MDCEYVASLDIGSDSMACCVLRNIEGDMAASLVDLQENGPAYVGDERGLFYPLMDGHNLSFRLRSRFALVDGRTPADLPEAHAELQLIARPQQRGADVDRSLFQHFFRDADDASLGAHKWLPNPKIIYQLAAKGCLPEVLDDSGQPAQHDPTALMQHLVAQVVRNFILNSTNLGHVDSSSVDLILTVPNVYSLPHTDAISQFVQDHTEVRSVRVVHESDAIAYYAAGLTGGLRTTVEELYGSGDPAQRAAFIQTLRQAYKSSPDAGVYIVTVDLGRGTADLSLVHVAWPDARQQYNVLARTGSNKAGNQLSYTFAQYYSAQLRAAYARDGLDLVPGVAERLWDFCSLDEQSRTLGPQQGYALDLLQRLIAQVKAGIDERYCLDQASCSYGAQRALARQITEHIVTYLAGVMAPAPDEPERRRLRDALAEALILPVGVPLGAGDPGKATNAIGKLAAGLGQRRGARRVRGREGAASADTPTGKPRDGVLDTAAWLRLGEELRDQSEDTPRALLENLAKAAQARGAGAAAAGMHKDNTVVVLAGQASQFRPLQARLRETCRTLFGCPDTSMLALSGREAKEACCWGALSYVLQRPQHLSAAALHGTYGFLDVGPEGFLPVDMAALNRGESCRVSFRHPGFRSLVFTPRVVADVDELGREYTSIVGFDEQEFEVTRSADGLRVNGRDLQLPLEGQALAEEEFLAKLWPEQIGHADQAARKRRSLRAPQGAAPQAPRKPSKRALPTQAPLLLLVLMLLLVYPAQALITRQLHRGPAAPAAGATREAGLPLPPEALLRPIAGDGSGYTCDAASEQEARLADALLALPLHQRLMKVAVANVDGHVMALVKLQAGDTKTRLFRVPDLQDDAVSVLAAAFQLPLGLERVDLWSVVPDEDDKGPVHKPMFSVSAEREAFAAAVDNVRSASDRLARLGRVRFAPQFLRYAGAGAVRRLPRTAWREAPLGDTLPRLREASERDRKLATATEARVIVRLPVTDNSVALTIDDGPHPLITSLFLEILRRENVLATFFIVGDKGEEFPELLRRTADAGHEIANHTYSHPRLGELSAVDALTELRAGTNAIRAVCDRRPALMRPPGGRVTADVLRTAAAEDQAVVLWTHNTNDWLRPAPEAAAASALRDLKPGSIILMHQGSMESVRALPLILQGARERGFRLRPVGEMLRRAPVAPMAIEEIMARYENHELGEE